MIAVVLLLLLVSCCAAVAGSNAGGNSDGGFLLRCSMQLAWSNCCWAQLGIAVLQDALAAYLLTPSWEGLGAPTHGLLAYCRRLHLPLS